MAIKSRSIKDQPRYAILKYEFVMGTILTCPPFIGYKAEVHLYEKYQM